MANFLLCIWFFIFGAIDFGMAVSDLSKKNYYLFGFELMTGIAMTVCFIINFLKLM